MPISAPNSLSPLSYFEVMCQLHTIIPSRTFPSIFISDSPIRLIRTSSMFVPNLTYWDPNINKDIMFNFKEIHFSRKLDPHNTETFSLYSPYAYDCQKLIYCPKGLASKPYRFGLQGLFKINYLELQKSFWAKFYTRETVFLHPQHALSVP